MNGRVEKQPITVAEKAIDLAHRLDEERRSLGIKIFGNSEVLVRKGTENDIYHDRRAGDGVSIKEWSVSRYVPRLGLGSRIVSVIPSGITEENKKIDEAMRGFNRAARRGEIPVVVYDRDGEVKPRKATK